MATPGPERIANVLDRFIPTLERSTMSNKKPKKPLEAAPKPAPKPATSARAERQRKANESRVKQ